MLHPLHFCYRLMKRFCFWAYTPTTREQLKAMFDLGRAHGKSEVLQKLPIVATQPSPPPIVELPETLQWPTLKWTRYYLDTHPHLRRQTGPLRKIDLVPEPTTDPINRLDTQPIVEATAKYESLPKELLPRFLRE